MQGRIHASSQRGCTAWNDRGRVSTKGIMQHRKIELGLFFDHANGKNVEWKNGMRILCISCHTNFGFKMFVLLGVLHVFPRGWTHLAIVTVSTRLRARCRNYNILALLHW